MFVTSLPKSISGSFYRAIIITCVASIPLTATFAQQDNSEKNAFCGDEEVLKKAGSFAKEIDSPNAFPQPDSYTLNSQRRGSQGQGGNLIQIPDSAIPGKFWTEDTKVVFSISNDGEQVFAYCERHPRWAAVDIVQVPNTRSIPRLGNGACAFWRGNFCYAFSTQHGTWDKLTLPNDENADPTVDNESVSVHSPTQGDFVYKTAWGKWFSADDIKNGKVSEFLSNRKLKDEPDSKFLVNQALYLKRAKAEFVASTLERLFRDQPTRLVVTADPRVNQLIVRTDEKLLKEVMRVVEDLDAKGVQSETETASAPNDRDSSLSKLREQVQRLDAECGAIATKLQENPKSAEKDLLTKSLQQTVQSAFDIQQQVQRAELAEFEQRLKGLGQSIESRQRIGKQVVDRRIKELLAGDLSWRTRSIPQVGIPQIGGLDNQSSVGSDPKVTDNKVIADFINLVAVNKGMLQLLSGNGSISGSCSVSVALGGQVRMRWIAIPNFLDARLFVTISVPKANDLDDQDKQAMVANIIEIDFTKQELEHAVSGGLVTKVFYLPSDLSTAGERLYSSISTLGIEAGADPFVEARKLGTVAASVQISSKAGL